jgi:hypothetical protein
MINIIMKSSEFIRSNRVADLTPAQITRIFENIINPNVLLEGINPQAAAEVKQATNSTLQKINAIPAGAIQTFDQDVTQLEQKIMGLIKDPAEKQTILKYLARYKLWAEKHPVTQAAILATLSVIASLTLSPIVGAVAIGLLKTVDELVLGKKAHQAVGAGVVAGGLAWGVGKALEFASGTEIVKSSAHWAADLVGDIGKTIGRGAAGVARGVAGVAQDTAQAVKTLPTGGRYY